jgi:YidC/Oxa1 family membrane protein insertase
MKKQDLIIVGVLFAALLSWPFVAGKLFPPPPAKPKPAIQQLATNALPSALPARAIAPQPELTVPAPDLKPVPAPSQTTNATPLAPEQRLTMTNAEAVVTISSWGGGISAVELKQYRKTVDRQSGPMILDFSAFPALAYAGLPELSARDDFDIALDSAGTTIHVARTTADGIFTRSITLCADFRLKVEDVFTNASDQPVTLRSHELQLGQMRMTGETKTMGLDYLGVDALPSAAGEGVDYWAGKLVKLFKADMKERDLAGVAERISQKVNVPVDWVAVKSKFFVQILAPDGGVAAYRVLAERTLAPGERQDPRLAPKSAEIAGVSAMAMFAETTLAPGESLGRLVNYYAGPKKYSILKRLGLHQEEVMDFGWWKPVCKFLLILMNYTYDYIPNYGIAIIILTILIRIIFWPLTHKSTESMKKMQALQPLMAELKAKYKDNPKKMQEETMGLYRKHKVNPVSGCLPMLIQIPVFIALFVVLRSAIELRFADFLWIRDLSEPENLLAGLLPYPVSALNILPVFMAATMFWQQKLTPMTTADPMQQKMMLWFMPIMMLVMFYHMPSALVLYWSTNQVIMIAQLMIQHKRSELKKRQQAA